MYPWPWLALRRVCRVPCSADLGVQCAVRAVVRCAALCNVNVHCSDMLCDVNVQCTVLCRCTVHRVCRAMWSAVLCDVDVQCAVLRDVDVQCSVRCAACCAMCATHLPCVANPWLTLSAAVQLNYKIGGYLSMLTIVGFHCLQRHDRSTTTWAHNETSTLARGPMPQHSLPMVKHPITLASLTCSPPIKTISTSAPLCNSDCESFERLQSQLTNAWGGQI